MMSPSQNRTNLHRASNIDGEGRDRTGPDLVGCSDPFRRMLREARRAAGCSLPVLVQGESGTGKEGVARWIHRWSDRREGPFVTLNCAAIPEPLLEHELFGSVRGSFTGSVRNHPGLFRSAGGGTLLLDEIGDMPRSMQSKLLRVLQEGRVRPLGSTEEHETDVRIVAASHRDLGAMVESGRFRADLFFRLAVIRLTAPPLRDRLDDLPVLVERLAERLRTRAGLARMELTSSAMARLRDHDWPGNVRELESVLARARLKAATTRIGPQHLELGGPRRASAIVGDGAPLETLMIRQAIQECGGVLSRAATRIGWTRQKLYRRMQELGLEP